MPTCEVECDWRALKKRRDAYRQRLIEKGVMDGSRKMESLIIKKFR